LPKQHTNHPEPNCPPTFNKYLLSPTAAWFWTTMILTITASTITLTIPEDSQFILTRNILSLVLTLWLPGYAFTKTLYPTKLPITTKNENLETVERIALSFTISIALIMITGLLLNYTPWGIRSTPIILSLLTLTVILAIVAANREYHININQPTTN
jgi:uncharacterized membrane protein